MTSFPKAFLVYKKKMQEGVIQAAYQGLMKYFMGLRNQLQKAHPDFEISGIQWGYMDRPTFCSIPSR